MDMHTVSSINKTEDYNMEKFLQPLFDEMHGLYDFDLMRKYFRLVISEYSGNWLTIDGKKFLTTASYNYLGLIDHIKIKEAAIKAIQDFGTGTLGTPALAGTLTLHDELEKTISRIKKTDDAIVFTSGYTTNLTVISTLVGVGDVVISDHYAHASIVDGCKLSHAQMCFFRHNDMTSLESYLKHAGTRRKLVIVDAVYSMDGDIANIPSILELCHQYDAILMVDEAHSLGVIGKNGFGIEEYFGLSENDIPIKMGTLSKSIPAMGGYVAGQKNLISVLKGKARAYNFSGSLTPPVVAAAIAGLKVLESEPSHVKKLQRNLKKYLTALKKLGFDTMDTKTIIVPILTKTVSNAFEMVRICFENNLYVLPIFYPIVPKRSPRLRTIMTALFTDDDIDYCVDVLGRAGREIGLIS